MERAKEMKITRRQLRGSPLLPICRNARIDRWLLEGDKSYCFCFGKYDASNDEPLKECKTCNAWTQADTLVVMDRIGGAK